MRAAGALGFCAFLCLFAPVRAFAEYRFDHFTTSNGLPQNTVAWITQTRDGYLWFATYDGLVRYDGVQFTVFDKGNTPGIGSNLFMTVCEDVEGTLWAGTADGGLVRYRDGKFTSFTTKDGLPENHVSRIQDTPKGVLLFFGVNTPVSIWTRKNSTLPADGPTLTEYVDSSSTRWVLEIDRLVRVKGDRRTTFPIALTADEFLRFRFEDRSGGLWLGTHRNGLYHAAGDTLEHYTDFNGIPLDTRVRLGGQDREGNVWIFTEKRLIRYSDGHVVIFPADEFLGSQTIRAVFCDREGVVWVGTNENGMHRLTRRFMTTYSEAHGIAGRIIYPLLEDGAGNIWIGSGRSITRFVNGNFTALPLFAEGEGDRRRMFLGSPGETRPGVTARAFCEDREKRMWIGLPYGLIVIEKDGRITDYSELFAGMLVDAIIQDRAGNVWIGASKGLFKWRDGAVSFYGTKDGLPDEGIGVLLEDHEGVLWVGTRRGLARLEGNRFAAFTTREGLVGDRVRSIYEDRDRVLWIGTFDSGLSRFKDGRFTNYTTQKGLFTNGVFQILEDARGYFWISSNRGIYRLHRQQLNDYADGKISVISSVAYGTQDGMLSTECNGGRQPAGVKARDGKLWFPTQNGVVVIDPEAVVYNTQPPVLAIEGVVVDHGEQHFTDRVHLRPGLTDLEIRYSAPSSIKAEHIQFKYMLAGLNDTWVDAGTRRSVHYSHLPPGRYKFRVIAANSDGVWNEAGVALGVTIEPYFYQTWWFFGVCAFGLVFSSASAYTLRVRRLKASQQRLTQLVQERTAALHEKTQQLEEVNEKLQELATLDPLTTIANRRRFREFLEHEWRRAQRTRSPISLLLIDVDYFKLYNDTYGHQKGDECLQQIATVLRESTQRVTDLAARYGGEEFAIVLANTDNAGARILAATLRARVEGLEIPHSASQVGSQVTASIGLATAVPGPESDADPDALIAAADRALYRAKDNGRNRCWSDTERPRQHPSSIAAD